MTQPERDEIFEPLRKLTQRIADVANEIGMDLRDIRFTPDSPPAVIAVFTVRPEAFESPVEREQHLIDEQFESLVTTVFEDASVSEADVTEKTRLEGQIESAAEDLKKWLE